MRATHVRVAPVRGALSHGDDGSCVYYSSSFIHSFIHSFVQSFIKKTHQQIRYKYKQSKTPKKTVLTTVRNNRTKLVKLPYQAYRTENTKVRKRPFGGIAQLFEANIQCLTISTTKQTTSIKRATTVGHFYFLHDLDIFCKRLYG